MFLWDTVMKFFAKMINKPQKINIYKQLMYIRNYILILIAIQCPNNLGAQTFGDIRACFDLEIQDTLYWILDYENPKKIPFKKNSKHFEHLAYLIFDKNDTICLEKWYTISMGYGYRKIIGMNSTPDTAWQHPEHKFDSIPPGTEEFITDSMITIFNSFRDSLLALSEKNQMSNDWKRFLRKSIPVSTAALFCSYPQDRIGQRINLDYYGRQIINTLTILRYIDCLDEDDFVNCIETSILWLTKARQYQSDFPISICYDDIYADPAYISDFYQAILKNIPKYIIRYPNFRDFLNDHYFKLYSGLSYYHFDKEPTLIKSFHVH